ncbi:MAG: PIN domain-containing protein [candidate division KSB1 bacterium]|nr:PIN domain-containing protein [candidate division KSB1 bacterium]
MKVVLDSNILFSALISGKESYIDILKVLDVYVPDFIFQELSKYNERILKKTKLKTEISSFVRQLFSEITVIPKFAISKENYRKAENLCQDIDPKDTVYLALSLELDIPLWSNDKELLNGLSQKGYANIITTKEIFNQVLGKS